MGNDTKHILLNVTRDLIDKNGINEISMRTVGKAARLSRSALYRHFESKEALLAAIVVENFNTLKNKINRLEENIKNPKNLLFELSIEYYNFGISNPDHYHLMFNSKWDENKYPDIKKSAISIFERVSFFISRAINSKQLNTKNTLEKTAIFYAFIHGIVELHLSGHNNLEKGLNDVTSLIKNLLDSILKK